MICWEQLYNRNLYYRWTNLLWWLTSLCKRYTLLIIIKKRGKSWIHTDYDINKIRIKKQVQEGIYDAFLEKFKAMAATRNVGNPFQDREVEQGPQVSENQFKRVLSYIESGKAEGATIYHGGVRKGDTGYFIEPTIFTGMCYIYKRNKSFYNLCSNSKICVGYHYIN